MLEGREYFHDFMLERGISEAEIRSMTDDEFQMTLNAFLDENTPRARQHQTQNNRQYRGTTLADGFGNGNLDEEEAMKLAIEASLDDMLIPPHQRPRPSPQNEVGLHRRPSSHSNPYAEPNMHRRNETTHYPPRPNPKPTPLPEPKSPRTSEYSKYTPKSRAPSCSRPSRPNQRPPPQNKKKNTIVPESSVKPQTRTKPTTTTTTHSGNHTNLVVTNSQTRISSGSTARTTPRGTINSRPPSSHASGTRQSTTTTRTSGSSGGTKTSGTIKPSRSSGETKISGTTRTTGTQKTTSTRTTGTTRSTATRSNEIPAVRPSTKKNTSNDQSNSPTRTSIGLAADEIIYANRPSANQTPRSRKKPSIPTRNPPINIDSKPKNKPTFAGEAIFDPTPEILHPKYENDDDYLFDEDEKKAYLHKNYVDTAHKKQKEPEVKPPKKEEKPKPVERPLSESQIIRNVQDMEFIMAQQEAEQKEKEEAEKKAREEMLARQEQKKKESKLDEAKKLFNSIPPEPQNQADSVVIAAQMPDSKRVMRKFAPNTKGIHIYAWISGQTLDLPEEDRLFIDQFELQNINQIVDKNKTLQEQNITKRVFLQIQIL